MSKKIKISVIGTGLMGLQHIKAINKSKKASLHSIVDINKNALDLSRKFNIPLFKDTKELLVKNKPDAVIVATKKAAELRPFFDVVVGRQGNGQRRYKIELEFGKAHR